jgi:hypothetical protein
MSTSKSTLADRANYAAIIIQPIHFILAITANTLNIIILTRRSLRSFPCSHYFLLYSIFSILYTCFTCPLQFLRSYGILWTSTPVGCKIQTYIVQTLTLEANLMILLASIDRFCSSSQSVKLRSISSMHTTRWIIPIGILVYAIYMSPTILIYYWNNTCLQYSGTHITVYRLSQIFVYYVVTLLLTALFSLLTIFQIRQQLIRVVLMIRFGRKRRTEGQLSRMLLIQVIAYLLFTLPIGVIQILMTFIPSMRTSFIQGLRMIFTMWQQCIFFLSFFLFIISGSIYRQEMLRLFKRIYQRDELTQTRGVRIHRLPETRNTRRILANTTMETHV